MEAASRRQAILDRLRTADRPVSASALAAGLNVSRQIIVGDIALLRADGGASVSDVLLQMQADLLRIPVDRPEMVETTAFGAAALAGLSCGFWRDMDEIAALRRSQRMFLPERPQADCDAYYRLWKRAVSRAADWIEH